MRSTNVNVPALASPFPSVIQPNQLLTLIQGPNSDGDRLSRIFKEDRLIGFVVEVIFHRKGHLVILSAHHGRDATQLQCWLKGSWSDHVSWHGADASDFDIDP